MAAMTLLGKAWRKPYWVFYYLVTKLSFWRCWLLKAQARFYGGRVEIGHNVVITHPTQFQGFGTLILGDNVKLGFMMGGLKNIPILLQPRTDAAVIQIDQGSILMNGSELISRSSIYIGKNCRVGAGCVFLDADFHGIGPDERDQVGITKPIIIGDNVWLGRSVTVLKGVHVGNDAIIGANCMVTKDIPAGGIAVGNPMRIVGSVYDRMV